MNWECPAPRISNFSRQPTQYDEIIDEKELLSLQDFFDRTTCYITLPFIHGYSRILHQLRHVLDSKSPPMKKNVVENVPKNAFIVNGLNGPLVHPLVLIQDLTGGYPFPSAIERFWRYLRPLPVNKTKVRNSHFPKEISRKTDEILF